VGLLGALTLKIRGAVAQTARREVQQTRVATIDDLDASLKHLADVMNPAADSGLPQQLGRQHLQTLDRMNDIISSLETYQERQAERSEERRVGKRWRSRRARSRR